MSTNILISSHPENQISELLSLIGQPARIQILFVISAQEACVCHLEAILGMRQASISQHLIVLRKAGLVRTRRVGRNIFYGLVRSEVVDLLKQALQLTGQDPESFQKLTLRPVPGCPCPHCNPDMDPDLTCRKARTQR